MTQERSQGCVCRHLGLVRTSERQQAVGEGGLDWATVGTAGHRSSHELLDWMECEETE